MNLKIIFVFLLLATISQAGYNEFLFRLAQSKNTGLYVKKLPNSLVETSLTINLDADGGCGTSTTTPPFWQLAHHSDLHR